MSVSLSPSADGVNLNLDELLYYKQHTVHWLPPAKNFWAQQIGQHQSRQLGRGMDFSEVRQYQAGDDVRSIDWRVTARTGKVHTKLFTEERERPVYIYLDLSSSMNFGSTLMLKSVMAAHFASLVAWLATKGKDRVGAIIDTGDTLYESKATASSRGVLHLLNLITQHHDCRRNQPQQQSLVAAIDTLTRLSPKGSEVMLISDFSRLNDEAKQKLAHLRQHNSVRLVHIFDPLEQGMTQYRGVEQVTSQTNSLWLDFASSRARKSMKAHFQKSTNALELFAQHHGMTFISLSNDHSLLSQLTRS
ncbi:DUF58 domain-containing protein [Vibrio sp. FNV 38]|nr:DUF58 domain-containing protein [Vibrio sp. FNV 38]